MSRSLSHHQHHSLNEPSGTRSPRFFGTPEEMRSTDYCMSSTSVSEDTSMGIASQHHGLSNATMQPWNSQVLHSNPLNPSNSHSTSSMIGDSSPAVFDTSSICHSNDPSHNSTLGHDNDHLLHYQLPALQGDGLSSINQYNFPSHDGLRISQDHDNIGPLDFSSVQPSLIMREQLYPRASLQGGNLSQSYTSLLDSSHNWNADTNSQLQPRDRRYSSHPSLVVTVDDYADGQCSGQLSNDSNREQQSYKKLNAHLSPSEEEGLTNTDVEKPRGSIEEEYTSQRDGFGRRNGVVPTSRADLSDDVPNLNQLEAGRLRDEKNLGVQSWLTHNEIESASHGHDSNLGHAHRNRPRAKSANAVFATAKHTFEFGTSGRSGNTVKDPSIVTANWDNDDKEWAIHYSNDDYVQSGNHSTNISEELSAPDRNEDDELKRSNADGTSGITANMAIMRFHQYSKDADNASVTATLGSRRLSESDIASVLNGTGISRLLLSPPRQTERNPPGRRINNFLGNILPSRSNSNKLKRKNSNSSQNFDQVTANSNISIAQETPEGLDRTGISGRAKPHKLDTNLHPDHADARSPKAGPSFTSGTIKQIFRSRSRSDLTKAPKPGLAELWTSAGGPPMPTLASPSTTGMAPQFNLSTNADEDSGDEEVGGQDNLANDLLVRTDLIIAPTYHGFKQQVSDLNPKLEESAPFLLERICQEQLKRYQRLLDFKSKHQQQAVNGACAANNFCLGSGGASKLLNPRAGAKDHNPLVGFQIMRPGMTEDDLEIIAGSQIMAAHFPTGVPLPPVSRLPAEFECSLCFKVKKFYKPSDWTKHIHEDVQPFTCTFPNCNEPKSFKRKADWVRHENERHRQLESWECNVEDCTHVCYRRDNFVQHLIREHKVSEDKSRAGRNAGLISPKTSSHVSTQPWQNNLALKQSTYKAIDDISILVEECHREAAKSPKEEPCKFCGLVCATWKHLTVHLAKHMEQISMPILCLINMEDTPAESLVPATNAQSFAPTQLETANELPTFLYEEPTILDMGIQDPAKVNHNTQRMMHSYPPATVAVQQDLTLTGPNIHGSSCPPASTQSHSRASSFTGQDCNSKQGTTYPPASMPGQGLSASRAGPMYHQQFFDPPQNFFDLGANLSNPYLIPVAHSPSSMAYSPASSTHELNQSYQYAP